MFYFLKGCCATALNAQLCYPILQYAYKGILINPLRAYGKAEAILLCLSLHINDTETKNVQAHFTRKWYARRIKKVTEHHRGRRNTINMPSLRVIRFMTTCFLHITTLLSHFLNRGVGEYVRPLSSLYEYRPLVGENENLIFLKSTATSARPYDTPEARKCERITFFPCDITLVAAL